MRHGSPGRNILFPGVDFLEDVDLILDVFKGGIVGQTIQQFLEELLGRHEGILTQRGRKWYPLIEDYRNAVRTFVATSPLPIHGLQLNLTPKKA